MVGMVEKLVASLWPGYVFSFLIGGEESQPIHGTSVFIIVFEFAKDHLFLFSNRFL